MGDHQSSASQRYSSQHSHFQAQHRHSYHQDIYGPLSAGVIEGGHRAFGFHSHPLHHPSQPSSSSSFSTTSVAPKPSTSSSRPCLTVADILERYQDASKDFLVSVLNAKAKEDERKAEEERYKTEQIKLQSKQLELDLALEKKRRGSPPTGNPPKASGRHYGLPSLASSAQSSPIAVVDFQSHIPPPLTPKEEHVSPTSAISPTLNLKRKSVHHDAVMDAVRAKVFRNAAGQGQQQQQRKATTEYERDHVNRRKSHLEKEDKPEVKLEGPPLSSLSEKVSSPAPEDRSRSTSPVPSSSTKARGPTGPESDSEGVSSTHETDRQRIEQTSESGGK
ncbi:hypothetical protein BGZ80_002377 [Entomortierella chlamydospora]|uniref:Uncharacterized protein n=1 Tax=Entomortierella chlamydospora TaxID=101097 RepID=A0A9P6MQ74_9FUNG|nr:hypothetical protein BGZ79_007606 [Entomortierella chlamydospora]KAG0009449.1 hypothetical protein BGZ80_002377 [Entomortierella chlamydospora]